MAGEAFNFWNDKQATDLDSFVYILGEISPEEFSLYVNQSKNDFANWIDGSLENHELAEKIRPLFEKDLIRAVIIDFLEKQTNKLIIGTPKALAEDSLVKEIMQKNEDFFKETENRNSTNSASNKTTVSTNPNSENFELKSGVQEKTYHESPSLNLGDAPVAKPRHSTPGKELAIGIIFGAIMGALLTMIVQQMIWLWG